MEELHEALSHLQPHEGHIVDTLTSDLGKALDEELPEIAYEDYEYEHELREAEADMAARYAGYGYGYDAYYRGDSPYDCDHSGHSFYRPETRHDSESASWRDEASSTHQTGFDLRPTHHEYHSSYRDSYYRNEATELDQE